MITSARTKKFLLILTSLAIVTGSISPAIAGSDANPYGTSTVDPAGPNEILLSITKGSRNVDLTYPKLLKLKQSRITIYEPFLKKRETFTVIKLSALFSLVGISGDDLVVTTALNDYIFKSRASQFIAAEGYLAIKRDGKEIGYDQGGPIRLIYPDKSKWAKNLDAWNWSIATISVK
ncbi:unannotated protein [freshwater metagenome]|uniref:Unannotated protein n=1 Tax=freshwater metagenome TaxID=449393 RepID=A0A6J7ES85_9ZZZZ|nr:hypothetical protein [Actinomycetota bacterium]